MIRRSFLKELGMFGLISPTALAAGERHSFSPASLSLSPAGERDYWVGMLTRIAAPVLENLAEGRLRVRMPVETRPGSRRAHVSHLEAFGRTLVGIAPWLELGADESAEGRLRAHYIKLSQRALARAVDPASPDFMNFTEDRQPLVDAAFLAHAVLRAPRVLWDEVDGTTRAHLVHALRSTRDITPYYSNWLLFSTMVEAALLRMGESWDPVRVDLSLRKVSEWYLGDGVFGDGPEFHWDYYNSYVIQPFLLDILRLVRERDGNYASLHDRQLAISRRYGEILERLVAPDGSFPPIGRSLTYRCGAFQLLAQLALQPCAGRRDVLACIGAFQLLAQLALQHQLPESLPPAQVRGALGAVIRRTLEVPGTFDEQGWLRLGLAGTQPELAEGYISTGSLYLCTTGFLPLGLPASDPFWAAPPARWTSLRIWSGESLPADHALRLQG